MQQRLRRMGVERALAKARARKKATSCASVRIELTYEEAM